MAQRGRRSLLVFSLTLLPALALSQDLAAPPPPAPPPAQPASAAAPRAFHVVGRFGLDMGGDTIAKVPFSDGSTQKLSAGGLVHLAAGLVYTPVGTPLVVEATVGYKVDDVTGSNGQLRFSRWPLELLASYRMDRHRVGGGLAYHLSPTYACDVTGECDFSSSADDALGAIVQYAYGNYDGGLVWDVGARATFITYQAPGGDFSGTSFGAFVSVGY